MRAKLELATTAWLQVSLVAINTWQIANSKLLGAIIVGFLISLVWTFNVKRVAFSSKWDRIVYSVGAAIGTVTGIGIARLLYS